MSADELEADAPEPDTKSQSKKTQVIEILFRNLWPEGQPRPSGPLIVTNDEVVAAIAKRNALNKGESKPLSSANPANFLKDFIRKKTCNTNWPAELKAQRITARQRYGAKQVMEFIDYREGDQVPFEDRFDPVEGLRELPFESLSLPLEARALGRADEPWLIQVIVGQRLMNTHLAVVASEHGLEVETLAHLQMSVKTQPEIDTTFVATVKQDESRLRTYITGEAKQLNERILEDQIREQVAKAFEITAPLTDTEEIHAVMPMVFKVVRHPPGVKPKQSRRGIYVAQFELITRKEFDTKYSNERLHELPLTIQSRAFYEPQPPIRGISHVRKAPRPRGKPARKTKGST